MLSRKNVFVIAPLLAGIAMLGVMCRKDKQDAHIVSIELKSEKSLGEGDTLVVQAVPRNERGSYVGGLGLVWESSDTSVATVSGGKVYGKSKGLVTIKASYGGISGQIGLSVGQLPKTPFKIVPVAVGADVPGASRDKITGIYSAFGSETVRDNAKIVVPAELAENLIFGLDTSQNILLVAFTGEDNIVLNAHSTALAIVRFGLNPLGTGSLSAEDLNTQILASSGFPALQSAVQASLNQGQSPLTDNIVVLATNIANEIISLDQQQASNRTTGASDRTAGASDGTAGVSNRTAAVAPNGVLDDGRHSIIKSVLSGENFWFEDTKSPGAKVRLVNDTRLYWEVSSYKRIEEDMGTSRYNTLMDDKIIDWHPLNFTDLIPSLSTQTVDSVQVVEPASMGGGFSVKIRQNTETKSKHVLSFIFQGIQTMLTVSGMLKPNTAGLQCISTIAGSVLNEHAPDLLTAPDGKTVLAYLKGYFTVSSIKDYYTQYTKCSVNPGNPGIPANVGDKFLGAVSSFWTKITLGVKLGTLSEFVYQMVKYWNYSDSLVSCKTGGILGSSTKLATPQVVIPVDQATVDYPRVTYIGWNAVPDATYYYVQVQFYVSTGQSGGATTYAWQDAQYVGTGDNPVSFTTQNTASSFTGVGANPHRFRVYARNGCSDSDPSPWITVNYSGRVMQ